MSDSISAARQIRFHQLLVAARKTWLRDALSAAMASVDPAELKSELAQLVPTDVQRLLAVAGIRDEQVFPVPCVLKAAPTLVGYYRLLLGVPQKSFYASATRMGRFKSAEVRGILQAKTEAELPFFCENMVTPLAELVRQLSPAITQQDVHELPLLTLGSQFQGGNNNFIGMAATSGVFMVIAQIVSQHTVDRTDRRIRVKNSSERIVTITLGADPDVRIEEQVGDTLRRVVAIEIKGGTDKSNAHNRAGEAEKSHQKAKGQGFRDYWTIIAMRSLDISMLKRESPTTNAWFDVAQILAREGNDWTEFQNSVAAQVGIPVMNAP